MNANWILKNRSMALGLLGASVLFSSPLSAQADQGKWWNPERGGRQSDARSEAYRPPAWRGPSSYRQGPRFWRTWSGRRVFRERAWIRPGWGYRGRPVYGWRYYSRPSFYYPRRICYVRPLRFFISAGAVIGGVSVRGGYADPCPTYGCNFCDARFTSFDDYEAHVAHCPYGPHGYTIVPQDWDHGQWDGDRWQDDHDWQRDDEE